MNAVAKARVKVQMKVGAKAHKLMPYVANVAVPGAATRDDFGEEVAGEASVLEGVPCDCAPLKPYERVNGGGVTASADWWIEFPYVWERENLTIPANATVEVQETDTEPARSFDVTGPLPSSSVWKQRFAAKSK